MHLIGMRCAMSYYYTITNLQLMIKNLTSLKLFTVIVCIRIKLYCTKHSRDKIFVAFLEPQILMFYHELFEARTWLIGPGRLCWHNF